MVGVEEARRTIQAGSLKVAQVLLGVPEVGGLSHLGSRAPPVLVLDYPISTP
jgi:hypothetical protein